MSSAEKGRVSLRSSTTDGSGWTTFVKVFGLVRGNGASSQRQVGGAVGGPGRGVPLLVLPASSRGEHLPEVRFPRPTASCRQERRATPQCTHFFVRVTKRHPEGLPIAYPSRHGGGNALKRSGLKSHRKRTLGVLTPRGMRSSLWLWRCTSRTTTTSE